MPPPYANTMQQFRGTKANLPATLLPGQEYIAYDVLELWAGSPLSVPILIGRGYGVTSVSASGGTTGLSFTGSPVTATGTLTLTGTLAIANGGTGQNTPTGALNALLPAQAGHTGELFTTDGTNASWVNVRAQANTSVPGGNTVANTAVATAFASTGTIAANSAAVGNVYRVTLYGTYSTAVLAPTLTLTINVGGTIVTTTASITTIGGLTNDGWRAEAILIVDTAGAAGVVEAQGYTMFGTAATTALTVLNPNTTTISGIDFTASNTVSAVVTWGTASASNTITLRQLILEKLP